MKERRRIKRPTLSLPLAQAEGNIMLVAIIAVLVFLSGMIFLAGSAAHKMTGRWNHTLANELTIEIVPKLEDENKSLPSPEQRIQQVKEILSEYSAVIEIKTVSQKDLQDVLKPWLGDISSFPDLPLPTLLDVSFRPGHDIDTDDLAAQISKTVSGVRVVAHYAWAGEVQRLAATIANIAWGTMGCVGFVLLLMIIFTARARLTMYASEVEILHTLGATDGFVAGEFQSQAFRLSVLGALIGLFALIFLGYGVISFAYPSLILSQQSAGEFIQDWHQEIFGLLLLPIVAVLLNTLAARAAVQSALRRLT